MVLIFDFFVITGPCGTDSGLEDPYVKPVLSDGLLCSCEQLQRMSVHSVQVLSIQTEGGTSAPNTVKEEAAAAWFGKKQNNLKDF